MNKQKAMVKNKITGAEIYFVDDSYASAYRKAEIFYERNKEYKLYHHCALPYAFTNIPRWRLIK